MPATAHGRKASGCCSSFAARYKPKRAPLKAHLRRQYARCTACPHALNTGGFRSRGRAFLQGATMKTHLQKGLTLLALLLGCAAAHADPMTYSANLTGAAEAPPNASPATGHVTV